MSLHEQRIKTAIDTLHAIETWFAMIIKEAGDEQHLGLVQRFTIEAIVENSLRLADICLLFRYLYTLPYRHPENNNPTCDPQVIGTNSIGLVDGIYFAPV